MKRAFLFGYVLASLATAQAAKLTLSKETWSRALRDLRQEMLTCREGKQDCFSDTWIDLITPENLAYQDVPAWMEASRKLTSLTSGLEKNLDYLQSPEMQEKAKAYALKYREELQACYQATCANPNLPSVPPSAVVAVKCIETGLKEYQELTLYPVLATVISLAIFEKEYVLREVFDQNLMTALNDPSIQEKDHTITRSKQEFIRDADETKVIHGKLYQNRIVEGEYLTSAGWRTAASSRSQFFKGQVYDLLNVAQRLEWTSKDLLQLQGSFAGAFSTSQVMPTTLLAHLLQDPNFDPNSMENCFKFTAMELQRLGWGEKGTLDVFYGYNRSNYYVRYCEKMEGLLRDPVCKIVGVPVPQHPPIKSAKEVAMIV